MALGPVSQNSKSSAPKSGKSVLLDSDKRAGQAVSLPRRQHSPLVTVRCEERKYFAKHVF